MSVLLIIITLPLQLCFDAESPLRRGVIGIEVRVARTAVPPGVEIARLVIGSPAYESGLRARDLITHCNGLQIKTPGDYLRQCAPLRAGSSCTLRISRNGEPKSVELSVREVAREPTTATVAVEYVWFTMADGVALRGVITRPKSVPTPHPVILLVPPIGGVPCDDERDRLLSEIAHAFGHRQVATVRWDARGSGDSYGVHYSKNDLVRETADAIEILKQVLSSSKTDRRRVFSLGMGLTASIAQEMAARQDGLSGVLLWGAVSRPLLEPLSEALRERGQLADVPAAELNRQLRTLIRFFARLFEGESPEALRKADPVFERMVDAFGHVQGKCAEYWRQLDGVPHAQLYGNAPVPVLALFGAHDYVARRVDQRNIVALAREGGTSNLVEGVVVPGLDHLMNGVSSKSESFMLTAHLAHSFSARAVDAMHQWMKDVVASREVP